MGSAAAAALGNHGRMLVYGTLCGEPIQIDPRILMVGQKRIEGFWLSQWVPRQSVLTMFGLIRRIGNLFREGVVTSEIGAIFPLDEVQAAVKQAVLPGRQGKVLLRIQPK